MIEDYYDSHSSYYCGHFRTSFNGGRPVISRMMSTNLPPTSQCPQQLLCILRTLTPAKVECVDLQLAVCVLI